MIASDCPSLTFAIDSAGTDARRIHVPTEVRLAMCADAEVDGSGSSRVPLTERMRTRTTSSVEEAIELHE